MRNAAILDIALMAIIAAVIYLTSTTRNKQLQSEVNRLSVELAHARIPLRCDTIRDTIEVATQAIVEVAPRKMKQALAADRQLIKELQLKVQQLQAMQTTVIETQDSVAATFEPTDSIFHYNDQWADLQFSLKDTMIHYTVRDSLATVVYRQYRRRFLWWQWGTKGYEVKIVNFNPHARITYNRYIKAGN